MRHTTYVVAIALTVGCRPVGHVIPDQVSCGRCEIRVEAELQIGTVEGPGSLLGRPTHVVVDSAGRFWVTMLDYGFPFVFDDSGQFLQQFGSPGSGPGEFQMAVVLAALPGDSVLLQAFPSFLVVGPELRVGRVVRGPFASWTGHRIVSWPHEVLALRINYAGGTANADVVLTDMSGDQITERKKFLTVTGTDQRIYRRVESASATGIWISEVTRYFLLHYGPDGSVMDSLERRPEWFPSGTGLGFGTPDQVPATNVSAIHSDSRGRLWVYIDRPQPDWRSAWRGISFPQGAREVRVSSLPPNYELWRTTVEVLDPTQRRVLMRQDLPEHVFSVLGPDRIATFAETATGIPVVTIHRITLVER